MGTISGSDRQHCVYFNFIYVRVNRNGNLCYTVTMRQHF